VALVGSKAGCLSFAFHFLVVALFGLFGLGYLGILSCILVGALRFFNIYKITYKKK
jgi:hypothetical protein